MGRIVWTLVALAGCTGDDWEARRITDDGTACLDAPIAGGEGIVTVDAGICLSSSCDRNTIASCTAAVSGTEIAVTAQFDWETAVGGVDCTADCGLFQTTCSTGPLPAGTYTLVLGDRIESVTVPTESGCDGFP